ncbi:MAG: hypothetical protein HOP19_25975 [Acidobacteria bacterium]|nr:hypothetical protein [Acidobacteriota bacterium]
MEEQNGSPEGRMRVWRYIVMLVVVPALIPIVCLFLQQSGWSSVNLSIVASIFAGYWIGVMVVLWRALRARGSASAARLASPLIELTLSQEMRDRLHNFADTRQQKLTVAAFELLDQQIPRFEQTEDRDRALLDNEHLRQQAGQGVFLVAVTNEILRRLLLISGAIEEDRQEWRQHINDTAVRIVSDALDRATEQPS